MTIEEAKKVLREADRLVSEAEVVSAIGRLATEITERLKDANPVVLCIMNGGLIFTGRLLPRFARLDRHSLEEWLRANHRARQWREELSGADIRTGSLC